MVEEYIAPHFRLTFRPAANPEAVVRVQQARFTLLTSRMIRMEYSSSGQFEDRASQAFWYRYQPAPPHQTRQVGDELQIETDALLLHYIAGQPFTHNTLWIDVKATGTTWHFGDPDPNNLGGTARTLDGVDGAIPISQGLVSRSGWSLVDDSTSLVFNEQSWLEPRGANTSELDLYFLGHGHDYLGALNDFNLVAGSVPMIPRWVLGNWWSRYWEYTQDELTQLIQDFESHQIPLSVCIIDMDWHITKTGNKSSGWTGYTWNRELFPDPDGLLRFLHEKGLKVALNLHPAAGIHPHEEQYEAMCKAMGMDPKTGEPVEFDITNPRFVDAYFRILHHPMEARGVDFWWMDWQQGQRSRIPGLDPLWWLNHLHFYDLGRSGKTRSFIFSRWGGLGNHRYPIGFSGDTVVTWASLAFQPYFTATASNVNYGWWSHDIGGHMGGIEDGELNARWVQMGVFMPVLRIHATKNPYQDRRPWVYDAESFQVVREAMQLRHELIPYLYSMAFRYHHENIPPLLPMYYDHPDKEEAYACPNQFMFGDQLVVAPYITPKDPDTRLARAVVWLPEGGWFDYFTGRYFAGDAWHALYGTLRETPVFAKAGAIVPKTPKNEWGVLTPPEHLLVHIFPGADGRFNLYDDEGNSNDYLKGQYALTPLVQKWNGSQTRLTVGPVEGAAGTAPAQRRYDLLFRALREPEQVTVQVNGQPVDAKTEYHADIHTLTVAGVVLSPSDQLVVTVKAPADLAVRADTRLETCQKLLKNFRLDSWVKEHMGRNLDEVIADPGKLGRYLPALKESQMRALFEVITGAGMDVTDATGEQLIVAWNNQGDPHVTFTSALQRVYRFWEHPERYPWSSAVMPRFQAIRPAQDFDSHNPWVVQTSYYGFFTVRQRNENVVKARH